MNPDPTAFELAWAALNHFLKIPEDEPPWGMSRWEEFYLGEGVREWSRDLEAEILGLKTSKWGSLQDRLFRLVDDTSLHRRFTSRQRVSSIFIIHQLNEGGTSSFDQLGRILRDSDEQNWNRSQRTLAVSGQLSIPRRFFFFEDFSPHPRTRWHDDLEELESIRAEYSDFIALFASRAWNNEVWKAEFARVRELCKGAIGSRWMLGRFPALSGIDSMRSEGVQFDISASRLSGIAEPFPFPTSYKRKCFLSPAIELSRKLDFEDFSNSLKSIRNRTGSVALVFEVDGESDFESRWSEAKRKIDLSIQMGFQLTSPSQWLEENTKNES